MGGYKANVGSIALLKNPRQFSSLKKNCKFTKTHNLGCSFIVFSDEILSFLNSGGLISSLKRVFNNEPKTSGAMVINTLAVNGLFNRLDILSQMALWEQYKKT